MRLQAPILALRVEIYRVLERWELMETVARRLSVYQPDAPYWPICRAFATRRAFTIPDNLACHEARLGNLESARIRFEAAIKLEPLYREIAIHSRF